MASVKCCFRGWETGPGVEEFQVSGNREQDGTSTSNKEKKKKPLSLPSPLLRRAPTYSSEWTLNKMLLTDRGWNVIEGLLGREYNINIHVMFLCFNFGGGSLKPGAKASIFICFT